MRIDAHTHFQPQGYLRALLDSGRYEVVPGEGDQLIVKEHGVRFLTIVPEMADPAERVAAMDADGIDVQVLTVSVPQVYFLRDLAAVELARECNDTLADMVSQHPDRFAALASIPLTASVDDATEELARCMDHLGMPGFLIGANIDGLPLDEPRFDAFYDEASRRGAVMHIHPMPPAGIETLGRYALAPLVGYMFDTTQALARLIFSGFFERYDGIRVVGSHLGGALPFLMARLDAGHRSYPDCRGIDDPPSTIARRLYLDTTNASPAAIALAAQVVGEDHLLFGSDYPHVVGDLANGVTAVQQVISPEHIDAVLGTTAADLYGLTTKVTGAGRGAPST